MPSIPADAANADRLRFAIVSPTETVSRWEAHAVEHLAAVDGVEVVAVAVAGRRGAGAPAARPSRLARLYDRLDRRWAGRSPDPERPVALASVLPDPPRCLPSSLPPVDALLALRGAQVAVRSRFGTLTLHVGDDGDPLPGLGPVLRQARVTRCEVRAAGTAVWRSFSRADRASRRRGAEPALWKTATAPARVAAAVVRTGELPPAGGDDGGVPGRAAPSRASTGRLVVALTRLVVDRAVRWWRARDYWEDWALALGPPPATTDEPESPELDPRRYELVRAPADRFWADPFPVAAGGRHYLFVEEMVRGEPHATIAVLELESRRITSHRRILDTGSHASYPFVFTWNGEWYLVPETRAEQQVRCYRATDFPYVWQLECVLLDAVDAVDATIAQIDGRWWLFCAIAATRGASTWDELHAFYAPTPLGPYAPHVANPVKSDVRSARPAGRIYRHGGAWYRPAQDCSVRYGWATVINRITRLDDEGFEEEEVARIEPWTGAMAGTHTVNAAEGISAMDARFEPRWRRR